MAIATTHDIVEWRLSGRVKSLPQIVNNLMIFIIELPVTRNEELVYEQYTVETKNPKTMESLRKLRLNDFIFVNGFYSPRGGIVIRNFNNFGQDFTNQITLIGSVCKPREDVNNCNRFHVRTKVPRAQDVFTVRYEVEIKEGDCINNNIHVKEGDVVHIEGMVRSTDKVIVAEKIRIFGKGKTRGSEED